MTKRLLITAALMLTLVAAVAGPPVASGASTSHQKVTVGIAEELPNLFTDPRFKALHITHVRLDLAWDALQDGNQKAAANTYMQAAHKDGVDVLITFDHSRRPGKASVNPTDSQLVTQMKAMRKLWPWVHEFSTWNEVNIAKSPTTVAKWWMALTKACPTCTVLGADMLDRTATSDSPSKVKKEIDTWVKAFLKTTHGKQPKVWGLHNYIDANLSRTSGTQALLGAVKGKVWFTETGGLVSRNNGSKFKLPQGTTHATNATKFILTKLDRVSSRIQRVYLYQWTQSAKSWDSAFVNSHGTARPALSYLKSHLQAAH